VFFFSIQDYKHMKNICEKKIKRGGGVGVGGGLAKDQPLLPITLK
jgi:hypothetical protein